MNPYLIFKPLNEVYKITISNTITDLSTAITGGIPSGTVRCKIQVETQNIRVKFNATNSVSYCTTAGVGGGFELPVNTVANPWYIIEGYDYISRARFYRSTTSNAYMNVLFEGEVDQPSYNGGLA
jgi:hypothetical protein